MLFKQPVIKTALFFIFLAGSVQAMAQVKYFITGQMGQNIQGIMVLAYVDQNNQEVKDTAMVKNGSFEFSGTVEEPKHATLELNPVKFDPSNPVMHVPDSRDMFIDPGKISVISTAGMPEVIISGGKSNKEFASLMSELKPLGDRGNELSDLYNKYKAEGNEEAIKKVNEEATSLAKKRKEIQEQFIKSNPDSYVAFSLWARRTRGIIKVPEMARQFEQFSANVRNSISGKKIANRIEKAQQLNVGNIAPDLTLPDTSGKPVSLSSFRGKNVVLCFWHRNFIPFETFAFQLAAIHKAFKDGDLAVVGVFYNATGKTNADWKEIVRENGMMGWTNLIDENGVGRTNAQPVSPVAREYDLSFGVLPQCYLLDAKGKILSRDINMAGDLVQEIKNLISNETK